MMVQHKIFISILLGIFLFPALLSAQVIESLDSNNPNVKWKVKPQDEIRDIDTLFQPGYDSDNWVRAIVPATVFTSYVEAGLEKDPNFADNIYQVDKAKYDKSFVYRAEFSIPGTFTKEKTWLNFRGINRKGEIFLNGKRLGELDGFMERGKFDISSIVKKDGNNILVVIVHIPQKPLNNVGSPTYLSSAGWDWMPYVPGLNSGITDKVYLSNTGALIIEDPWVRTDLPTNAQADLAIKMSVKNTTPDYQSAKLKVTINPGNIQFTQDLGGIWGNSTMELDLNKNKFKELVINNPRLWWPNGYGKPNLYTCNLELSVGENVSYKKEVKFGIKRYSYDTDGDVLHVSINGKRVFLKGGNWGMSEYLLRCRGDEYDTKIRLHKEMNFNMIRNWLGSTTDDEFYEACDKYGILVWDDFWLNANPVLPADIHAFNKNAIEKIKRVRNHPSIAVWCGNNEGYPVAPLKNWLKENIATFDAGDRYYQAKSNDDNLSGSGVWGNFDPRWYFIKYPASSTKGNVSWGLRTEIGTAVFVNYESFKKFMPEDKLWPRNEMWNQHFFGQLAFNATPDKYEKVITERYGKPVGIEDFCRKAQLLNIETNQSMYEGWLDNMWNDASGILIWMSQSAYPSMVWQTYDYYYDLTGAFWGAKNACVPLHIQWNSYNNSVKIINTTSEDHKGLTAEAAIYNSDGKEVSRLSNLVKVDSYINTATNAFTIPFYDNNKNIATGKDVVASSTETGTPKDITDGNMTTRWGSRGQDDQWVYVDLGKDENVYGVGLNFEDAYGKKYKIQVSADAKEWKDVYTEEHGKIGLHDIYFDDITARYVRMQGIKRGSDWGYSLWEFKVYGGTQHNEGLTDIHFVRLTLKDNEGNIVDENTYWRGTDRNDFTALNSLPKVNLKVMPKIVKRNGKYIVEAKVTNPSSSPAVAFAVWVQLHNSKTKERILPAILNDNYFTLLNGESKDILIEFDESLLKAGEEPVLTAIPYNNRPK
nr:discoidin domain-containing protein [Dysgonomonas sp. GY75]